MLVPSEFTILPVVTPQLISLPVQRITRYPLLFKQVRTPLGVIYCRRAIDDSLQIIHYTEPGEDHHQVEAARETAEKVLEHINETIREQESRERLKEISKDLWVGQG